MDGVELQEEEEDAVKEQRCEKEEQAGAVFVK